MNHIRKIFIAGSDKIYAIENFYVKYLRATGIEVFHFSAQSIFYDYYQKNILNKLIFKSGLSGIYKIINDQFKETVRQFEPDVIWIFKGMEIYPGSLKWAKDRKIKLVNFNGDSPFIFSGKGSGNKNVTRGMPLFDLHLTYNTSVKKKMDTLKIPVAILPFGFNLDDDTYKKCIVEEEIAKTCFLGNPDAYRGKFLQQLAKSDIKLDVYGNDWNKFVSHPNITVFAPVYGDDFWMTLRKYRIQLNLMRPHNPDTHNMRTFEVPGVGGIQLAPSTDDHITYFEPGKEIFLYDGPDDCIAQIKKIIALPKNEVEIIRHNARRRSIISAYQYKDRAVQALQQIKEILE